MKNSITAQRLKEALNTCRMKQEELANASGVSKASISQYINGSHSPSNISSGKLASVLQVNPLWLMGFDVPKHEPAAIVPDSLSFEEITLLNAYRSSSEEIKTATCAVLGITREKESFDLSKIG
jgi:transcriptional regulator with XRE-family HTH domain